MTTAEILAKYGDDYGKPEVHLSSEGKEIYVTSDLHIAGGRASDHRYSGTENFFFDEAYTRFLSFAHSSKTGAKILVINGDFIDFLRITEYPDSDAEHLEWQKELAAVGITKLLPELKASVSKKEKTYGLRTNDYKSIWKLNHISQGHTGIFDALAKWIADGNSLIISKGNHDLEWYYPNVRRYCALLFARHLSAQKGIAVEDALTNFILPNIRFIDDALVFDKVFYIEHGHRYDKFSHVVGDPLWKGTDELNIPFGSFLNRYLINNMELVYPYLDNIKPTENILHLLMREHFPMALKVLSYHIPFLVRIIPKRYYRYMFIDVLGYFIFLGVPLGLAVYMVYRSFAGDIPSASDMNPIVAKLLDASKSVGMLASSYFLSRVLAYFRLKEATGLSEFARDIFNRRGELKYITMGHTHHADQFNESGKWFFNSGTWIPVIESSSASLDEDRTFVFLHMKNDNGVLEPEPLMRWNDDAGRPEELILIRKKGE